MKKSLNPALAKKDVRPAFTLRNLSAGWQPDGESAVIRNINLTIGRGKLVFIVGPVGSGKTSLLHTLMRECFVHQGSVETDGSDIAYCCQQPWIQEDSIRQNITFGEKFKLGHYLETIKSCALIRDMELLKDADWSMIGDRDGVQLSGGQRYELSFSLYLKNSSFKQIGNDWDWHVPSTPRRTCAFWTSRYPRSMRTLRIGCLRMFSAPRECCESQPESLLHIECISLRRPT